MKELSINKFWEMRPKLPFRFKAQFFTGLNNIADDMLSYCVTSINLPKMEGQASDGSMYLGDTIFTIPVWNIASRKLDITFEETDKMLVSQFIDRLNTESYGKIPWRITVVIHQFAEHMRDEEANATAYICHLTSYDEPSFKRDGAAAQVTLNASFIVDTIINNWNGETVTGKNVLKATDEKLNPNLDSLQTNYENEKFKYGDVNFGVPADIQNGGTRYKYSSNTRDFDVSQEEIDNAYEKIQKSDKFGKNVKKEDLANVQRENARRMSNSMDKFKKLMQEKGYNVDVNAYNDANHATGVGTNSGSHLMGQKIDLTFSQNGSKLTPNNMTESQVNEIIELARQAGLTPNWETNGSSNSGWGDFALQEAKSIDKNGNVIDLHTTSWTGEKKAKNTGTGQFQEIGKK